LTTGLIENILRNRLFTIKKRDFLRGLLAPYAASGYPSFFNICLYTGAVPATPPHPHGHSHIRFARSSRSSAAQIVHILVLRFSRKRPRRRFVDFDFVLSKRRGASVGLGGCNTILPMVCARSRAYVFMNAKARIGGLNWHQYYN
jgi:hypothetical protein